MKNPLSKIPVVIRGTLIERVEPCRVCNMQRGEQFAMVDYWNIKTSRLVKCPGCNHIQLDPMLNDKETAEGCYAYYLDEALRTSHEEQVRNCVRNFRRGVLFGYSLRKRNVDLESVLELGPGSGYFSAGIQYVFPEVMVTVMDVNSEVLRFNREHHGYKIIEGIPDNLLTEYAGKFDLVIARDILEHVTDISKVLVNVNRYLLPDGLFHFITPNGHEDVWKHYLTSRLTNAHSELLINHVNYFDGKGLKQVLNDNGFTPVDYYTFQMKTTLRGAGWKMDPKLKSPVSTDKDARLLISTKAGEIANVEFRKSDILRQWYIQKRAKWITRLYAAFHHSSVIRINPELNVGHEIYGLFRKSPF